MLELNTELLQLILGRLKMRVGSRFVVSYRYHGIPPNDKRENRITVCTIRGLKHIADKDMHTYNYYVIDLPTYFDMALNHNMKMVRTYHFTC